MRGESVDLRQLRTFLVVARCENFHEAARQLYLSQPTVSKHIRQLEEGLECRLFERRGRRVALTPIGEQLFEEAQRLVEGADNLLQAVAVWKQGYRSRLRIAASPMVARTVLPDIVREYARSNPEVELSVLVTESTEIPRALAERKADLGLARTPARRSADMLAELLYSEPVVLVAPSEGGECDRPTGNWGELLSKYPLLTHNHPEYWDVLLARLRESGILFRSMRVTQIDITVQFVQRGLGISFLPYSAVSDALAEKRVQEVPTPELNLPMTGTYLIVPRGSAHRYEMEAFVSVLKERVGGEGAGRAHRVRTAVGSAPGAV